MPFSAPPINWYVTSSRLIDHLMKVVSLINHQVSTSPSVSCGDSETAHVLFLDVFCPLHLALIHDSSTILVFGNISCTSRLLPLLIGISLLVIRKGWLHSPIYLLNHLFESRVFYSTVNNSLLTSVIFLNCPKFGREKQQIGSYVLIYF